VENVLSKLEVWVLGKLRVTHDEEKAVKIAADEREGLAVD
jgi:hypothetical protein